MLKLPVAEHIVQVYVAARCELRGGSTLGMDLKYYFFVIVFDPLNIVQSMAYLAII